MLADDVVDVEHLSEEVRDSTGSEAQRRDGLNVRQRVDALESEIIVPSGHWSNQHPLAIEEIRRILYLHIGKSAPTTPLTAAAEKADYAPLLGWLREKVHARGAVPTPAEIVKAATGKEPSAEAHLAHLAGRYLG